MKIKIFRHQRLQGLVIAQEKKFILILGLICWKQRKSRSTKKIKVKFRQHMHQFKKAPNKSRLLPYLEVKNRSSDCI